MSDFHHLKNHAAIIDNLVLIPAQYHYMYSEKKIGDTNRHNFNGRLKDLLLRVQQQFAWD